MKKIIYSQGMKAVAALMFIVAVAASMVTAAVGFTAYTSEGEQIYAFENNFNESSYINRILREPEDAVINAYYSTFDTAYETVNSSGNLTENQKKNIETFISEQLEEVDHEKIEYYVKWNDKVFTNCDAESAKVIMKNEFFRYTSVTEEGKVSDVVGENNVYDYNQLGDIRQFDSNSEIQISVAVTDSYLEECRGVWERQADIAENTFTIIIGCSIIAVILLIYLLYVAGKDEEGNSQLAAYDRIWMEVQLIVATAVCTGAIFFTAFMLENYMNGYFTKNMIYTIAGISGAAVGLFFIAVIMSLARNIKLKKLREYSLLVRITVWIWNTVIRIWKWIFKNTGVFWGTVKKYMSTRSRVAVIVGFFIYTAAIGLCGIIGYSNGIFIFAGFIFFLAVLYFLARRGLELDRVKVGASEVRKGNLSYKIEPLKNCDLNILAEDINEIADGMDESLSAKLRAERMKTELITNVSHDLKTPLTSIISYTELLSSVENLPEEASDYLKIISKKSHRLKTLIQDLFDISKVQSGTETVILEKIDASLLISQSMGEHDSEIVKSELEFCVNADKEHYIKADGRKMSRAVGNLIENILKYTMKGTRVFITVTEVEDEVLMEFKNISSYHIDVSAEDLMSRFVRGDESRSTEGNGLGLAIAKSYTELCDGKFEVIVDGDMFKVIIKFRKYNK